MIILKKLVILTSGIILISFISKGNIQCNLQIYKLKPNLILRTVLSISKLDSFILFLIIFKRVNSHIFFNEF